MMRRIGQVRKSFIAIKNFALGISPWLREADGTGGHSDNRACLFSARAVEVVLNGMLRNPASQRQGGK
jgi:hypothetical protein